MSPVNAFHRITRKQDRLFDTLRDPRAVKAAAQPGTATDFDALKGAKYSLLVTFRRSGEPVATPVWFGLHDGRVYARTLVDAGKVKRLRQDPHVRIALCDVRGNPAGPFAEGVGGSSVLRGTSLPSQR